MDFKTADERSKWIIKHSDYFTVIEGKTRHRERHEVKSLLEAEDLATELCRERPGSRWMIYAVAGPLDTWVKTVSS